MQHSLTEISQALPEKDLILMGAYGALKPFSIACAFLDVQVASFTDTNECPKPSEMQAFELSGDVKPNKPQPWDMSFMIFFK